MTAGFLSYEMKMKSAPYIWTQLEKENFPLYLAESNGKGTFLGAKSNKDATATTSANCNLS